MTTVESTKSAIAIGIGSAVVSFVLFSVQGLTSMIMMLGAIAPEVSADMTISARPVLSPMVSAAAIAGIASLVLAVLSYKFGRRHHGRTAVARAIALGGAVMWGSSLGLGLLLERAPGSSDWWWLGFLPLSENVLESAVVMVVPALVAGAAFWVGCAWSRKPTR